MEKLDQRMTSVVETPSKGLLNLEDLEFNPTPSPGPTPKTDINSNKLEILFESIKVIPMLTEMVKKHENILNKL